RAIGHYARWVPRGSVRVDATSDDPLVQVTAFLEQPQGRIVLVVINNAGAARTLQISVGGVSLDPAKMVMGEQSTAGALWQPLGGPQPQPGSFTLAVPAVSVTSVASALAAPPRDAGVAMDAAIADAGVVDAAVAPDSGGTAPADAAMAGAD